MIGILLTALAAATLATPAVPARRIGDEAAMHAKVEGLIRQMTLEEKAGQLTIVGDDYGNLDELAKAGRLMGTNGVLADREINSLIPTANNMLQTIEQLKAVGVTLVLAIVGTLICALITKVLFGLRVSPEVESEGLDVAEHGEEGYILS